MAPAKEVSVSPATVAKPKLKLKEKEKENEKQNEKRNDRDKQWEEMGGTVLCTSAPNGRIRRTYVAPSGEKFRSWKECERFLASADKNMKNDSAQKPNKRRKATQENESQEKDRENGEEMEEEEDDKQEEAEKKSPHIKANSKSKDKSKRHKKRARDEEEEEGNADGDNENEGETKAKRKQPKRSAACDNFRETKGCEKVCKDDYVKDKKEKIVEDEATAVSMTRTRINTANPEEDEGPESLPQRRLTDFILHDEEGEIRPIEMADVMDIYITGLILPRDGDVDKGKGVRCEGFGFVESWSITGYEDGVATIWFTTESGTEYECVKPNGLYKKHFDMFYDKASLCVQVYKLLSKPDGGDPLLGFDDMLARVVRSMNGGKRNSGARFYGKEYVISHGKFVVNQLFALDKDSSGSDQIFQGLPALVTLQEECQMLEKGNLDKAMPCTSGIKINDVDSLKVSSRASSEECAMNEDEKLARLLQEQENWNASKIQRKFAQSKKVYIRINENEIVNDYPMPDFYSPVEDEVDEYMLFEDTPMAAEDLPRRMLHDWCLYNAESRLVPLELVPMLPDMQIDLDVFGSGIMTEDDGTGYCLESESSANSSSRTEPVSGIRVYLSAIKEWMIEFGASMLFISIRTDGAWYRLGRPSKQYSPWYNPVLKTARIAIQIITMLKEQSRASKLSFSDVVKKLCDQTSSESTFISSSFSDVERYIVVHGQIILQQFAEYPDGMIKRSSFIVGLSSKMEQRKHTKLKLAKHKIIIKEKNLNPSASFKLDSSRPMQMHATTTKLVYRIWKEYYSGSDPSSMALENNDGKDTDEQEDQEQSDEEEETILVSDNKVKTPSPATVGRGRSSKKIEWLGKSTGKLPSGEALYRKALMHGFPIVVGGAVLVDSEGSDDQPIILFVEYMYEKSGIEFLHGRVLEKGNQTVLGNAANDREVFLTLNCLDVGLSCVKEHVSLNIRMRSWGYEYRKENAIADERDRMEAKELEKKQKPTGYYCKALYVPEKGAFFKLPLETLGIGSGECYSCNEKKKEELVFELFVNKDGFSYKAVNYSILDFVYIDPTQFASDGEEKELEIFKAGRNKGLKAYAVCQILEIKVSSAGKDILKSTEVKVRRFFRPEDVGSEKAYHADIRELFYSEETAIVSVSAIQGKCYVKRQQYFLGSTGIPIADHTFWCNCIFDPSKGTIKQLPATVRIDSSRATPVTKGKSKVVDAKMKGKAIAGDSLAEEVDSNTKKSCLATLDIFAGCGGLSLGLQQSGVCFTKWAIEYEKPAADAFKLNHPEAEVFCDNCNVILRAIMEKGGDDAECICTTEATELAAKLSTEIKEALPLPGEVEFINGGPPCQGFSGMNRFNQSAWSKVQCEMILAFLSYADYFRPKFFLLENVRNLVSFNKGQTFRLTLASLLEMGYQVRFGVLQAGNYGVAQSRKRAFIWAASPDELLPEWPEPMHVFASSQLKISLPGGLQYAAVRDASVGAPFRSITVRDTIGDLPSVGNGADKPEIKYGSDPVSWFQKQIRGDQSVLYDHISKEMNELNFIRCQRIPKRPGADWRDLPEEKVKLSTGQEVDLIPWCLPNTANKHNQWKGLFGRLDWEGNFPTSITDPQPMGKVGMCFHPEQNRIVTVRECARSQGFPDNYKFCGTIHHKHKQIGNAVPPPLAAALGKKLRLAIDANKST